MDATLGLLDRVISTRRQPARGDYSRFMYGYNYLQPALFTVQWFLFGHNENGELIIVLNLTEGN